MSLIPGAGSSPAGFTLIHEWVFAPPARDAAHDRRARIPVFATSGGALREQEAYL